MTWNESLANYDKIIALNPGFERKGKTMPYTSANGHMFSQLNKAGELGIRLPKDVRQQFLNDYDSGPFMSYGAVMREYVLVPKELCENLEAISSYMDIAHTYVNSLPAKSSKKR
ncbi:hypothetical protein [Spongiimicrobium sp. 3-5]|uniref:hypothetical protein n=1 Tax=Spongiimicrobium sp. 3-5 TaxID=3332596 RepID=UPI0039807BCA